MRELSERWKKLAKHSQFTFDTKATINGRDYFKISAPRIARSLMTSPLSVGNCISATLDLSIMTEDEIPPGEKVKILGRLFDETLNSEWVEFGTFFIDQRETDYTGLITVSCFDSMKKANQRYLADDDTEETWPRSQKSVVEEIAFRLGVGIDPRTRIRTGPDYIVTFPEDKTMEQVLGYIGACHGGNWIITEENLLRLVPLVTAPDETYHVIDEDYRDIKTAGDNTLIYKEQEIFHAVLPVPVGEHPTSIIPRTFYITDEHGNRVVTPEGYFLIWNSVTGTTEVEVVTGIVNVPVVIGSIDTGPWLCVSRVTMTGESGEKFTAGDDTGYTLEIESNPYATQGICNDLLTAYRGLAYFPYTATKSLFDPAAELGDQVKIGDRVHSVIYGETLTLDHNFRADITAPNSQELTSEFPYLSDHVKIESIEIKTKQTTEEVKKVKVKLEETDQAIIAEVRRATGKEDEIGYDLSLLEMYVDGITLSVSNSGKSSTITLKSGEATISSQTIRISGFVEFSDLAGNGTTTINGANIKTGVIDCSLIRMEGTGGGFASAHGFDGTNITDGAKVYGKNDDYYCIATDKGVCMRGPSASFYVAGGRIVASTAISESSDRNMKNSISYDMERYRGIFERLKPAFFKFNDGTSGRFHTGFIAQDVEKAIAAAGLDNKDFAALTSYENEIDGVKAKRYGLRYTEFTALNTYMIQQAFKELAELRKEVAALRKQNSTPGGHDNG